MATLSHRQARRAVDTTQGKGQIIESQISVEDNILPSADEMAKYKTVDPGFVHFFMDSFKDEQQHRHHTELAQIEVVDGSRKKEHREVITGMLIAFVCFLLSAALIALALYLDKDWLAAALTAVNLGFIIRTFITRK